MAARYAYPKLLNCGLAHELVTWARCVVWCEDTGAEMVAPFWSRPRLGPWMRREADKRLYGRYFHANGAIAGIERTRLLLAARDQVEVFATERDGSLHFLPETKRRAPLLRYRLEAMTRPEYLPQSTAEPFIAVHVRMGDFKLLSDAEVAAGAGNARTPVAWFVDLLCRLRAELGVDLPAVAYSDGRDEALAPLLSMPAVRRSTGEAITDLLEMSNSTAIIGSGSGFSIIGSMLGDVPRVSHPGQRTARALENEAAEIESGAGEALPDSFLHLIADHRPKMRLAA